MFFLRLLFVSGCAEVGRFPPFFSFFFVTKKEKSRVTRFFLKKLFRHSFVKSFIEKKRFPSIDSRVVSFYRFCSCLTL